MNHAEHSHTGSHDSERPLWLALGLTGSFMGVEVVGGLVTGSLALLSDAGHMATDVFGIGLALIALRFARRPADLRRTFGYGRLEILAGVANAVLLILLAGYILYEAVKRFSEPPQIQSVAMLVIATIGLIVNFIAMRVLAPGQDKSLNLRGAYLEVWSDFIGSLGVIVAAVVIWLTGWSVVDTIVAIGIGAWVLPRTWTLLSEAINVLLEGVPRGLETGSVQTAMLQIPGVVDVHDLHVWSVTSGGVYLTAHIVAPSRWSDQEELIAELRSDLATRFSIGHVTFQIERQACNATPGALP